MQNNDSFEMFRGTEIDSDESPDLQMKSFHLSLYIV